MKIKRVLALVLAAALILSLSGCGKTKEEIPVPEPAAVQETVAETPAETAKESVPETEPAAAPAPKEKVTLLHPIVERIYESAQNNDNTFAYQSYYEYAKLNDEEAKLYSNLDVALKEDLTWFGILTWEDFREEYLKEYPSMKERGVVDSQPFSLDLQIVRADSDVCSFVTNNYSYMGGAHGSTILTTFNYDSKSGQLVDLASIVKDDAKLKEVLKEKLKAGFGSEGFFDLENDIKRYQFDVPRDEEHLQYKWTYSYEGLTFIFNQGDIAPYAAGTMSVALRFVDYPDLLNNIYGAAPDRIAVKSEPWTDHAFCGRSVNVSPIADENNIYTKLEITVDNEKTEDTIFGYKGEIYLANTGAKQYVMVFYEGDDDEDTLKIYDISDKKAEPVKTASARLYRDNQAIEPTKYNDGSEFNLSARKISTPALVDPDKIKLETKNGIFEGSLEEFIAK